MDETKQNQSAYMRERTKLATLEGSPVPHEDLSSLHPDEAAAAAEESQAEAREIAQSLAGKAAHGSPKPSRYSPVSVSSHSAGAGSGSSPFTDFLGFVKQTKRIWLIAGGAIFGLMALITGMMRVSEWATNSRERRHEQAVASVTPERLLSRCGQPTEDLTKDMYPILMRTMTYRISRNESYVFAFSRTAEEKSDWVFLSMQDATGKSYDTPEAKVAAMSCLDSRK